MYRPAAHRLRTTVRVCFVALIAAAAFVPYFTLKEQKERAAENYTLLRQARVDQLLALVTSPAGELALFNPDRVNQPLTPMRPAVLAFREVQADDPRKVVPMFESLGCPVQFQDRLSLTSLGTICVAVGREPTTSSASNRVYIAGSFVSGRLVPHVLPSAAPSPSTVVAKNVQDAHRVRIDLNANGQSYRWIVPIQARVDAKGELEPKLQMTAYRVGTTSQYDRSFTGGWVAQDDCLFVAPAPGEAPSQPTSKDCLRQTLFSIAIPRDKWGEQFNGSLKDLKVEVAVLPPGAYAKPLLDSNNLESAQIPFSRDKLAGLLRPGEVLTVSRRGANSTSATVINVAGPDRALDELKLGRFLLRGVKTEQKELHTQARNEFQQRGIRLDAAGGGIQLVRDFERRGVSFQLRVNGPLDGVDDALADTATRMAIYGTVMLVLIIVAWITIEIGIVRRVLRLTKRTAKVSKVMRKDGDLEAFDFSDLRGNDELGVLAAGIDDLLNRISEDVKRETLRNEQERDMLHAIGHEIRSPLQAMGAILPKQPVTEQDREVATLLKRMLNAVKNLYGSATPAAGIDGAVHDVVRLDLAQFLRRLVENAHAPEVGFENVIYEGPVDGVTVRVDPAAMGDAIMHILTNAKRYQPRGSPIRVSLHLEDGMASVKLHNQGERIPADLLGRIFEYGVSDQPDSAHGNRGQGLYVAKTYLAQMGASIAVFNREDGVEFVIDVPLVS